MVLAKNCMMNVVPNVSRNLRSVSNNVDCILHWAHMLARAGRAEVFFDFDFSVVFNPAAAQTVLAPATSQRVLHLIAVVAMVLR